MLRYTMQLRNSIARTPRSSWKGEDNVRYSTRHSDNVTGMSIGLAELSSLRRFALEHKNGCRDEKLIGN